MTLLPEPLPPDRKPPEPLQLSDLERVRFDPSGLVPVIVQHAQTLEVLTLAYANREALERTLQTRLSHFWSRSRRELWIKGLTSGHWQQVVELRLDCDRDAVLYRVIPTGPACHTGRESCFFNPLEIGSSRNSQEIHP